MGETEGEGVGEDWRLRLDLPDLLDFWFLFVDLGVAAGVDVGFGVVAGDGEGAGD